jgi:putative NIF3 family GTP cyclohydrolase 1 type 2
LLVEPSGELDVKKVLITNDLTEAVFAEAVQESVNMIIAYHPVIFKPLKRLTQAEWKQRSIIKCIENRIAVFCPHTSWDSVNNGTNDWILEAFGEFLNLS